MTITEYGNAYRAALALANLRLPVEEKSAADKAESALLDLITKSVVARYSGRIERWACTKCSELHYIPRNPDRIRELLADLWGTLATPRVIELAFERLTRGGAETWPQAWCDEDVRTLQQDVGYEMGPSSWPPDLAGMTFEAAVEAMVEWFFENFEDPAENTPYESAEGGYQYIWGGPHDAREELENAFDDLEDRLGADKCQRLIAAAVARIDGWEWAPSASRLRPEGFEDRAAAGHKGACHG